METMRINRLPAITWNRMDINDTSVNLPKLSGAELAIDTNKATISAAPLDVKTGAGERADAILQDFRCIPSRHRPGKAWRRWWNGSPPAPKGRF